MNIRHNALILVADGMKYLLLRNHGDFRRVTLAYEGGGEMENPATREQGSDVPGRAFSSSGTARSAMQQTDWHQIEEDRFAARIAEDSEKLSIEVGLIMVTSIPLCVGCGCACDFLEKSVGFNGRSSAPSSSISCDFDLVKMLPPRCGSSS